MTRHEKSSLSRFNRLLSVVNILVAIYILIMPFFPSLLFWINQKSQTPPVIISQVSAQAAEKPAPPTENRLVIPSILLDEQVFEGPTIATLHKGVWRRPNTSTPNIKGNTVMAGHVFTYSDPQGVFYNLNKVNPGDSIAVYWEGSEYLYTVQSKQEVPNTAVQVEAPTDDSRLTLYTCTPIWHPVNRLVITSGLTKVTKL